MHKEQLSQELLNRITAKAENTIREVISTALSEEISRALTIALTEGEFYRSISTDLQEGLKTIYREISAATANGSRSVDHGAVRDAGGIALCHNAGRRTADAVPILRSHGGHAGGAQGRVAHDGQHALARKH